MLLPLPVGSQRLQPPAPVLAFGVDDVVGDPLRDRRRIPLRGEPEQEPTFLLTILRRQADVGGLAARLRTAPLHLADQLLTLDQVCATAERIDGLALPQVRRGPRWPS
ncbi:hypothetical protein GCM10022245_45510 [Streptomyces mayteni]